MMAGRRDLLPHTSRCGKGRTGGLEGRRLPLPSYQYQALCSAGTLSPPQQTPPPPVEVVNVNALALRDQWLENPQSFPRD